MFNAAPPFCVLDWKDPPWGIPASLGIPTNILASRLVKLESAGFIRCTPYQVNPRRFAYTLIAKGEALKPVLRMLPG